MPAWSRSCRHGIARSAHTRPPTRPPPAVWAGLLPFPMRRGRTVNRTRSGERCRSTCRVGAHPKKPPPARRRFEPRLWRRPIHLLRIWRLRQRRRSWKLRHASRSRPSSRWQCARRQRMGESRLQSDRRSMRSRYRYPDRKPPGRIGLVKPVSRRLGPARPQPGRPQRPTSLTGQPRQPPPSRQDAAAPAQARRNSSNSLDWLRLPTAGSPSERRNSRRFGARPVAKWTYCPGANARRTQTERKTRSAQVR